MIDNTGNMWLIEVNTNPCLEESSPLLQKLIPRMLSNDSKNKYSIDDGFRLTIDKIFPPPKLEMLNDLCNEFAVPGYNNQDNLFELIGKIGR